MGTEILLRATGGGTTCPAPMTAAAAAALESGGALMTGCPYIVTDWTTPGLAGPNLVVLTAASASAFATEVKISTPLGFAGPCRGLYVASVNLMVEIGDTLGNTLYNVTGAFPWGTTWTNNVLTNTALTAAVAAQAVGVNFSQNRMSTVTIDFTGATGGSFVDSTLDTVSVTTGAETWVYSSQVANSTITNSGSGRALRVISSRLEQATVTQTRTVAVDADILRYCEIIGESTLLLSGATNPGSDQIIEGCRVVEGSSLNLTNPAGSIVAADTAVAGGSTLNVQAGGSVDRCRIGGGAAVNTGAFAQVTTTVEFAGTTTLTAGNTGKYKGFGVSNVT